MNKKRALSFLLVLGVACLVHGNGKTSFFSRITGIARQGSTLRIDYTNAPGYTEIWLGATNQLSESVNAWQLIATNTQTALQISNSFEVNLSPGPQPMFLRLVSPKLP